MLTKEDLSAAFDVTTKDATIAQVVVLCAVMQEACKCALDVIGAKHKGLAEEARDYSRKVFVTHKTSDHTTVIELLGNLDKACMLDSVYPDKKPATAKGKRRVKKK